MLSLSDEQCNILNAAVNGHNVFITGQGGTGKSFLAKEIYKQLTLGGKKVAIVCSTGIACKAYKNITNSAVRTVHSFYGLGIADLPWPSVVDRSLSNNLVRERVQSHDCIIWDEIGMVSRRVFEIANMIHHKLSKECDAMKPMGGKQVIIAGVFFNFHPSITCSIQELRIGQCGEKSTNFLHGLSRELPTSISKDAVHIFFRRLQMQVHNKNMLFSLPEKNLFKFDAIDTSHHSRYATNLDYQADKTLLLKLGCRVMLLWNVSEALRNGVTGVFVGTDGDNLAVDFDVVGRISLKRETWEKRSRSGAVVASRRQFPVTLAYGITCHKSQSSTVSAAVVHCSKEFTPGLIYVACSRVKTSAHLQVLHFSPDQLMKPSQDCLDVCASHKSMATSADKCCVQSELTDNELVVNEQLAEVDETGADDEEHQEIDDVTQKLVNGYFDRKEEPDEEENFDLMI
ncbi:ATP-dependent DNA helicase PIF1 [Paramuricea clavata]|uniref:ATP-dependent DNA helicase n=1 Tax=Paramuricea clavata TaxID=317549 RepID=A0A7D9DYG4_PARCT|nr:ATP-dependent DNA helicase PIF1 [Paramuricea clavata]